MGYGLQAAIGAKVVRPEALVIDLDGDASFNMTLTELGTAAQFNIPIKVIICRRVQTLRFSRSIDQSSSQQRRTGHDDIVAKSFLRRPLCAHASEKPRLC